MSSGLASYTRHLRTDRTGSAVSRDVCWLDEAGAGRHGAISPVLGVGFFQLLSTLR